MLTKFAKNSQSDSSKHFSAQYCLLISKFSWEKSHLSCSHRRSGMCLMIYYWHSLKVSLPDHLSFWSLGSNIVRQRHCVGLIWSCLAGGTNFLLFMGLASPLRWLSGPGLLDYTVSHLCFKWWPAPGIIPSSLIWIFMPHCQWLTFSSELCSSWSPSIKDLNSKAEGREVGPDYATLTLTGMTLVTLWLSVLCHPGVRGDLMRPLGYFNQGEYSNLITTGAEL